VGLGMSNAEIAATLYVAFEWTWPYDAERLTWPRLGTPRTSRFARFTPT
jgi:hypothetical protein